MDAIPVEVSFLLELYCYQKMKEGIKVPKESVFGQFTLDVEEVKKIISTPRTKIRHTNVPNDLKLSKSERIANAERILKSRKGK